MNENHVEKCENKKIIMYESCPNGSAEIKLKLNPDGRFTFYMTIYPELGYDENYLTINYSGKWFRYINWVRLKFSGGEQIINVLFDDKVEYKNEIDIINKNTIEINTDSNVIHIWGIRCERVNKTRTIKNCDKEGRENSKN